MDKFIKKNRENYNFGTASLSPIIIVPNFLLFLSANREKKQKKIKCILCINFNLIIL